MNKWGVRLIACFLFIMAISNAYKLIANPGNTEGSSGWHMSFGEENINIDFMEWVEVAILVYAGFQLFRFQPSGRYWALFMLWIPTLVSGGFLVLMTVAAIKAFYQHETINASLGTWFGNKVDGIIPVLLFFTGVFVFYFIPTYFLMRKDVKQLFEKPVTALQNNPNPETPPS